MGQIAWVHKRIVNQVNPSPTDGFDLSPTGAVGDQQPGRGDEDDGRSGNQEIPASSRLPAFQSFGYENDNENEDDGEFGMHPSGALEHTRSLNEGGDFGEAKAILEIAHHKWAIPSHFSGISFHDFQRSADVWSEVNLVNDQKVGFGDAWSSFAGDFFPTGHINDINRQIGKFRTESRGQVIAARLNKYNVGIWVPFQHPIDGFQIDRRVLANGRVWAPSGFNSENPFGRKGAGDNQKPLILLGVDVVGDNNDVVPVSHQFTEHLDQSCFAGSDGAADADAQWWILFGAWGVAHGAMLFRILRFRIRKSGAK